MKDGSGPTYSTQVADDTPLDSARVQSCDLAVIIALFYWAIRYA